MPAPPPSRCGVFLMNLVLGFQINVVWPFLPFMVAADEGGALVISRMRHPLEKFEHTSSYRPVAERGRHECDFARPCRWTGCVGPLRTARSTWVSWPRPTSGRRYLIGAHDAHHFFLPLL
jgi:hypothetical protein